MMNADFKLLTDAISELDRNIRALDEKVTLLEKDYLRQGLKNAMTNTRIKELENDISEIKFRLDDGLYDDKEVFEERVVKYKKVVGNLFQPEKNEFVNGEGKPMWIQVEPSKHERGRGVGTTYICSHCYAEFNEPHSTCPHCTSEMGEYFAARKGDGEND